MTIDYVGEGDIFRAHKQTVVCPVNTVGIMGAGLALAFKKRAPGLFKFYVDACKSGELKMGTLLVYPIPDKEVQVLLFPTKEHWSKPSERSYIETGLKVLVKDYKELNIKSLAMVPVGCGRGQMDFIHCVKPLLLEHLEPLDIPVSILMNKNF